MRDDALQEAWVAHLEGREPNSFVRAFLRRQERRAARERPFSQLPPGVQAAIHNAAPA
jgi:hypothetical protein